jgi:hypothetical protein
MVTTELMLVDAMISVPRINLFVKYRHFLEDPAIAKSPDCVKSSLAPAAGMQFAQAIQRGLPDIL